MGREKLAISCELSAVSYFTKNIKELREVEVRSGKLRKGDFEIMEDCGRKLCHFWP